MKKGGVLRYGICQLLISHSEYPSYISPQSPPYFGLSVGEAVASVHGASVSG